MRALYLLINYDDVGTMEGMPKCDDNAYWRIVRYMVAAMIAVLIYSAHRV